MIKLCISRDIRNQCFMWAIIMLAGALLSCFLTPYIAIPTYIIWLVLFFEKSTLIIIKRLKIFIKVNFGLSNNTLTKKGADLKSVPLNLHALFYRKRFSHRNYRSYDFFLYIFISPIGI